MYACIQVCTYTCMHVYMRVVRPTKPATLQAQYPSRSYPLTVTLIPLKTIIEKYIHYKFKRVPFNQTQNGIEKH